MRKFVSRALKKLSKMDRDQVQALFVRIAEENDRLEVVLDSMKHGVIVLDLSHKVSLYNKAAERLVPCIPGDGIGTYVWNFIADREISLFIEKALSEQEQVSDREFNIGSSGVIKVLTISLMPLVREGRIQGTILQIEDITEKRSREARLRRAESLAALTTLSAGVAHEIKNPLGSIGIHIQLIQKIMRGKASIEPGSIEHYLNVLNEEVERLNRIVVDFLFAVRPMDTHLVKDSLNRVLRDFLDFVHYELEEAGIDLVADLDENIPDILLDEKYMKQALLNIVKNALAAMPEGGTLTVRTRREGDTVVIRITDTGTGIPAEIMDKIFEPYFTTKDFGSGLGLTLVYKIVKEHLGEISVQSRERSESVHSDDHSSADDGFGTTFIISFPVPQGEKPLIGWEGVYGEV